MKNTLLVRQGALGDFILTIPLLRELAARTRLTLVCRRSHRALLPKDIVPARWVDCESADIASLVSEPDTEVHLFRRRDPVLEQQMHIVWHDPRPSTPPHAAAQFLEEAGLPVPVRLLETPFMPRSREVGDALWLHSGSGSRNKILPFTKWSGAALASCDAPIIVSFGEADLALMPEFRKVLEASRRPFEFIVCPQLCELRNMLASRACAYWGFDTGVTHLAAALGLPVTAIFVSTSPEIWRPCGHVTIIEQRRNPPCPDVSN